MDLHTARFSVAQVQALQQTINPQWSANAEHQWSNSACNFSSLSMFLINCSYVVENSKISANQASIDWDRDPKIARL